MYSSGHWSSGSGRRKGRLESQVFQTHALNCEEEDAVERGEWEAQIGNQTPTVPAGPTCLPPRKAYIRFMYFFFF